MSDRAGWTVAAALPVGSLISALVLAASSPAGKGRPCIIVVGGHFWFGKRSVSGYRDPSFLSLLMLLICGDCDNVSVLVPAHPGSTADADEKRGRVSAVNRPYIGTSEQLEWI